MSRRAVLAAGGAALALPKAARAQVQAVPTWPTEFRRLAPNVYAFVRGGGPNIVNATLSNSGVLVGPDNVTVIDAQGPPVQAHELLRAIRTVTDKPITRVVNTHHHRDHTNGNYLFQPAEIVMTPIMRDLVIQQGIPDRAYADRPEFQERLSELRLVEPTTLITSEVTYKLGQLEARVMVPGRGHSYGDIMVYLPQHKLLFSGDIGFFYVTPGLHTGDTEHWLTICDQIQKMDVETIVPGHGPIGGKTQMAEMADYIRYMRDEIRRGYDAGKSPGRAAAEVRVGKYAQWAERERFAWASTRLYAEWRGTVKPEQDLAGQAQALAEYRAIVARDGER